MTRVPSSGFRRRSATILILLVIYLVGGIFSNRTTSAAANAPFLISQATSTRAVAMESICQTSEPFALASPYASGSDKRTRVMLFAMDLKLQPGENFSVVTADAENASHQHYDLPVEYVGPVSNQEWLTTIIVRLNENLSDAGDVLVQISYGTFGRRPDSLPIFPSDMTAGLMWDGCAELVAEFFETAKAVRLPSL